jgi:hypothetical protein
VSIATTSAGPANCRMLQWPPRWHHERIRPLSETENGLIDGVELRGLEPLTPTLPGRPDGVRGRPLKSEKAW